MSGRIYNLNSISISRPVFKILDKKYDVGVHQPYTFVNFRNDSTFIFLGQDFMDYFFYDVFAYSRIQDNHPAAGFVGFGTDTYHEIDYIVWVDSINSKMELFGKRFDLILGGIDKEIVPKEFYLYQNFPNPFNPMTKINFVIPKISFVTLKVFDILGREVASLLNEEKLPGEYNIKFNAANLSRGVYFYQLKADNFIETKKMILAR